MSQNNLLTESKWILFKNQMRKDFFNRLDQSSMRHYQPTLIKKVNNSPKDKMKALTFNQFEKKKKISDKIRLFNSSQIKKKQRMNSSIDQSEEKIREGIEEQLAQSSKKAELPKIEKREIYDPFAPKYETKYIDNVEKQFIKPYINNKGMYYIDYIENKKSKIPFNFCIRK